jgi:N-acetylglucosamine kinase-like BadF-type ATPase
MSFRIGVDGGGTKTECILLDGNGIVAASHLAPGCNPSLVGAERARAILISAIQALVAGPSPPIVDRVLLCMAGSQSFWRETAAGLTGYGRIETASDSLPVLELATGGDPGLALHAGTGSFVTARAPDGSVHYAGGLGWRFGDPGSGYDLGCRGIARALLELQGWAPRTALAVELSRHTGLPDYTANSRFFYRAADANAAIAAFAPCVIELAGQDCPGTRQIIADSLAGFAGPIDAVLRQLFPGATMASPVHGGVSGALLNRQPCRSALHALAAAKSWPVQLQPVTDRPIEGVRRLVHKLA